MTVDMFTLSILFLEQYYTPFETICTIDSNGYLIFEGELGVN
jgi:hypothetical protein